MTPVAGVRCSAPTTTSRCARYAERSSSESFNDHEPANAIRAVEAGVVDTVQVIYNVFDQTPADELLPATMTEDLGVIVRVPFDEGGLTGSVRPDTEFPEGDFRARYFEGERKREIWSASRRSPATSASPTSGSLRSRSAFASAILRC